jgi:small subunit ribosomal protein S20
VAHHASALKQMRQSLKNRARNRQNLAKLKTQVKKFRAVVAKGDAEAAKALLPETMSEIDRAAKKGIVHDNAASRYKSRLSRRINSMTAAAKPASK